MGLFSLIIEKFYEELEVCGQQLKGICCIQYPVYCIHANIVDNTADPLDNLDRAIVDFLISKPDFTPFQIGCLMGTSKSLVELRMSKMLQDGLLFQKNSDFYLSTLGDEVFKSKSKIRQHKESYDFYIDGVNLKPLPKAFYSHYTSKFISENDSYYHTNPFGDTYLVRPFGPDIVHTPPEKSDITERILNVPESEREMYCIPKGLQKISDISFTKLSLQLLVSISSNGTTLKKELIDGFSIFSLSENISYYESVRKNVRIFEETLKDKIANLEFKINIPLSRIDRQEQPKPVLTTNWQEIERYKNSQNKCFSFSSEDLLKVMERTFQIKHVVEKSLINSDKEIIISINSKMLLSSSNRPKLINDLIRERDYKHGIVDNNVFLLFIYYKTTDDFVKKVVALKRALSNYHISEIKFTIIENQHPEFLDNYRQLLIAAGELEILERLDIEKNMLQIF